ncbi:VrtJ [Hirsutella rhossiliensis]|uniref:VrtJ n=1 Tax=Hirsutella rhossiliensis TaxID=111463 RepID=A0A9P8MRI4_9HYPO|nr:VrtJ [Hirsutella rhossiliensis]KAH0959752.1 VrtJ [Hirsutella rhossiliensis]
MFPDELKGLTPVEEKLISLNSCYGSWPQSAPAPLLQALDEIHISWQGAEKPAPSDLSSLLSVRRRVVERALVWLKRNNPHYAEIEIDAAEMESWETRYTGYRRRCAIVWSGTSRLGGRKRGRRTLCRPRNAPWTRGRWRSRLFALLNQGQEAGGQGEGHGPNGEGAVRDGSDACPDQNVPAINEVTSSGMFALDGPPDVADVEKLQFACDAVGEGADDGRAGPRAWVGSLAGGVRGRGDGGCEPYIRVSRGGEFTDSFEASFFARTFPTLFPFGVGGPRLVEETMVDAGKVTANLRGRAVEAWAEIVLRRHGGRFALHHIFAFSSSTWGAVEEPPGQHVECGEEELPQGRAHRAFDDHRKASGGEGRVESSGKTTDGDVKELSGASRFTATGSPCREVRLNMRRKIQSLIVGYGVPAIWFTINPNDITNPVKLRLAAYRTRDPDAAEEFLEGLGDAYKRARLAISDPMSSAVFFHREMKLFFDHYVKVGEESAGSDQESFCAVQAERSVTGGIDPEDTQHGQSMERGYCCRARHNHDISFIATQRKTMALIYYVTNYATKVEDPVWKRVAAAAELLAASTGNRTRQFLMRVANRVFTERPLSQVEVVAHLLGYPAEFTDSSAWAYLNCSLLYWEVFRRWRHLREASGAAATDDTLDESVVVEEEGLRISHVEAYQHRGELLKGLCLYDYISIVRLKRIGNDESWAAWGEMSFEDGWAPGRRWVQVLRRPGKHATVCLDGYLSKDFTYDDESCYRRAAVQHLALFVPGVLPGRRNRISCLVDNVQLLRRSAEDAKRDAKQWAASSGDGDPTVAHVEEGGAGEAGAESAATYQPNSIGDATRLIDVVRGAGVKHARAGIFRGRTTAAGSGQGYQVAAAIAAQRCEGDDRFREDEVEMTMADSDETAIDAGAGMDVQFGPSTSFLAAGKVLATRLTLNKRQSIAFLIICRQLDLMQQTDGAMPASCASSSVARAAERFIHGQSRMDWQEKDARHRRGEHARARTLHAVNERLRRLRGSRQDFGGIPIVLFCGDFQQFRPVQERSIVLPSAAISWDVDNSFKAEQRHQHDKAHALWKRFTTVVMLDEQMRAAGDPELQRLLKRIRLGVQDRTDLNLLNSRCYRGKADPWETGITVVTPLNRNRWNLNMEASLAFRWKEELPTEEEAIMILNQGDDSAIPVPAVFMFVAGMPIVVNHNTHQGLKLVNGASYSAVEVIVDKAYPGHRISADMTIHFGRRRDHSRIGDDEISPLRRDAAGHDLVDTHDR